MVRLATLMVALLAVSVVHAADIRSVTVEREGKRYIMQSVTWFDAPIAGVFDVLTDYEQFQRISSVYSEARFLTPADDGTPRVYTEVKGCVLWFCQTMERTEILQTNGTASIRTLADPAGSDFEFSDATWALRDDAGGTLVEYRIEMQPAFWVPPVVGPFVMKRQLIKGGRDAVIRIEALAKVSTADESVFRARGLQGFEAPESQ
ncbi:MAG: SRPBCC family protein [Pseudomonadota bacterium]